jgi:hypothetical protein
MSNKPSHTAYVVVPPEPNSDRKPVWHPVAGVWQHKNGGGFDLVIPPGVTLSESMTFCGVRGLGRPSLHPARLPRRSRTPQKVMLPSGKAQCARTTGADNSSSG